MKSFFKEFREFALNSNVMALAVGVIIGGAFQSVVSSLTDNILAPIIGLFVGMNFDALQLETFGVTIKYGAFITSSVDFLIMAFVVFLIVKAVNKLMAVGDRAKGAEDEPPARACPYCKSEIHEEATRCPSCTSQLALE